MTLRHTMFFSLIALIGGFLGSWIFRPVPAQAQQNLRSENQVLIPTDGLRFVTENQRTVAMLGLQGGNAAFVLFDAAGRPSIGMSAGLGGSITLRALQDGATIEVATADGRSASRLSSNTSSSGIESAFLTSVFSVTNNGANTVVTLPGPNNAMGVQFMTNQNGGQVNLFGPANRAAMTAEGTATGGQLTLRDATGKTAATVSNAGTFASHKEGRVVWQAPPAKSDGG